MFNPYIRGRINYYSHFFQSALDPALVEWTRKKFKHFSQSL
jgi:hypothetical protein